LCIAGERVWERGVPMSPKLLYIFHVFQSFNSFLGQKHTGRHNIFKSSLYGNIKNITSDLGTMIINPDVGLGVVTIKIV